MSARAMWKGVIKIEDVRVPVKLYSAVEDRSIRFRLVHASDVAPVKQVMVHPETGEIVPFEETRRGYVTPEREIVVLEPEELEVLEPEASRDVEVLCFLPPEAIDHRWYDRPYHLGPDEAPAAFAALQAALEKTGREGLARWVMRNREYLGALRLHRGRPVLVSLRSAEEVVPIGSFEAPEGPRLDAKELAMAEQLMQILEADFDPEEYEDEYRGRVLELIETKARGGRLKLARPRRKAPTLDLLKVLEASVRKERKGA